MRDEIVNLQATLSPTLRITLFSMSKSTKKVGSHTSCLLVPEESRKCIHADH